MIQSVNAGPAEVAVCEIVPRPGATPERLRALGRAIARWRRRAAETEGTSFDLEFEGVSDLLRGELPRPLALRTAEAMRKTSRLPGQAAVPAADDLVDLMGDARGVILVLWLREPDDLRSAAETILGVIPAGLPADVLIDGEKWGMTGPCCSMSPHSNGRGRHLQGERAPDRRW